jgi:hypothetical protein
MGRFLSDSFYQSELQMAISDLMHLDLHVLQLVLKKSVL